MHFYLKIPKATPLAGTDPGEVKWVNFHPPFSEPPSFFSYPSNIEIFDSSDIITKIHPPFQNPGSALAVPLSEFAAYRAHFFWGAKLLHQVGATVLLSQTKTEICKKKTVLKVPVK